MARIAGTDLPKKKRMEYALTYIFGIGLHTSRIILDKVGVSYDKRAHELTEDEIATIRQEIQANFMVEGDLRKKVAMDIKAPVFDTTLIHARVAVEFALGEYVINL